jgi:hypothetical protein
MNLPKFVQHAGTGVVLALLWAPASLHAQRRPLFLDSAVEGEPDDSDQAVVRSRFVRVSFRSLLEWSQAGTRGAAASADLELNLFPDRSFRARLERADSHADHTAYFGRLEGPDAGELVLVVRNGLVAGSLRGGGKLFQIRFAGGNVHEVQEIDPDLLPPESEPLLAIREGPEAEASGAVVAADDGTEIHVLVAYTATARAAAGSTDAIRALIDLGIAETNQAYLNSGAVQKVRLVGTVEVAYPESGDIGDDLTRLRLTADGNMDEVHALRNTFGADLVHLIVNGGGCGIAYVMDDVSSSFASFAFGVTRRSCVSPNLSFAHELGHNMGLQHDRYVTLSNSPYAYSHGYVNLAAFVSGAPSEKRWRTVMAYNDRCSAAGFGCTRLMYFSDPAKSYNGDPLGVAGTAPSSSVDGPANARLSLDNTRVTVANFRATTGVPGAPTLVSPSGNVVDETPEFRWLPVPDAAGYRLRVRKGTVDLPTHGLEYTASAAGCSSGTGVCSVTPAAALTLGAHTFWIQAFNANGASPWSAGSDFSLVPSGFDSQFNGATEPWQAHSGAWSNRWRRFFHTAGIDGAFSSVSYPESFTDLDFRVRLRRNGSDRSNATEILVRGNPVLAAGNEWAQGYRFRITRDGFYSVYRDQVTPLQGWTATSAIRRGIAWNELRVLALGPSLQFYINDILVWSGSDASLASGRVGVGMHRGAGTKWNQLLVDYATLGVPDDPGAESAQAPPR